MNRHDYLAFGARETALRGTDLPQAKLTEADVIAIRRNRTGRTAKQWADVFGVHVRTINKVLDYRSWVHVRES